MERILLFSSPADDAYDPYLRGHVAEPPLGLLYLCSGLERSPLCQEFFLIDGYLRPSEVKSLEEAVSKKKATQLWISFMSTEGPRCFGDQARKLKEKFPGLKIVAGGSFFRGLSKSLIHSNFPEYDLIVIGDPDLEIDNILEARGIYVSRPLTSFLEVPYPRRDLVNLSDYFANDRLPHHLIIGARGCSGRCTFCAISCRNPYLRNPQEVALEIQYLYATTGIPAFSLIDDVMAIRPERFEKYKRHLRPLPSSVQLDISWRIDRFSEKIADELAGLHIRVIRFGVEAIDPEVQRLLGKRFSPHQVRRSVRWCKERNLSACLYFLFGFPFETEETIARLLDFMAELSEETMVPPYLGIVRVLEGTPLMETYQKQGWIGEGEPIRGLPLERVLEILDGWRKKFPAFFMSRKDEPRQNFEER